MPKFTVYFVVKDWIEVGVNAKDEETAQKIAETKVDKSGYKDKAISIVDGKTKFACIDGPEFDGHLVNYDLLLQRLKIYLKEEKKSMELFIKCQKGGCRG